MHLINLCIEREDLPCTQVANVGRVISLKDRADVAIEEQSHQVSKGRKHHPLERQNFQVVVITLVTLTHAHAETPQSDVVSFDIMEGPQSVIMPSARYS